MTAPEQDARIACGVCGRPVTSLNGCDNAQCHRPPPEQDARVTTVVVLRLSPAEAEDLQRWLSSACKDGVTLRQEARALGWRLHDRLGLARATAKPTVSAPAAGEGGEPE